MLNLGQYGGGDERHLYINKIICPLILMLMLMTMMMMIMTRDEMMIMVVF